MTKVERTVKAVKVLLPKGWRCGEGCMMSLTGATSPAHVWVDYPTDDRPSWKDREARKAWRETAVFNTARVAQALKDKLPKCRVRQDGTTIYIVS